MKRTYKNVEDVAEEIMKRGEDPFSGETIQNGEIIYFKLKPYRVNFIGENHSNGITLSPLSK